MYRQSLITFVLPTAYMMFVLAVGGVFGVVLLPEIGSVRELFLIGVPAYGLIAYLIYRTSVLEVRRNGIRASGTFIPFGEGLSFRLSPYWFMGSRFSRIDLIRVEPDPTLRKVWGDTVTTNIGVFPVQTASVLVREMTETMAQYLSTFPPGDPARADRSLTNHRRHLRTGLWFIVPLCLSLVGLPWALSVFNVPSAWGSAIAIIVMPAVWFGTIGYLVATKSPLSGKGVFKTVFKWALLGDTLFILGIMALLLLTPN